jgi:hypothetical protein
MAGRGGYLKEPRRTAGNLSEKSAPGGGGASWGAVTRQSRCAGAPALDNDTFEALVIPV